jgi:hypothetical protein
MLTDLVVCRCDHDISAHGGQGCETARCACCRTADEVLEAAISSVRLTWSTGVERKPLADI